MRVPGFGPFDSVVSRRSPFRVLGGIVGTAALGDSVLESPEGTARHVEAAVTPGGAVPAVSYWIPNWPDQRNSVRK